MYSAGTTTAMDVEAGLLGQNVQVVDPEVRAYVYSLVTAVSISP